MAASGLHISISAETIANIGGFPLSNSIFTSLIVSAILIALAVVGNAQLKKTNRPKGLQNFLEFMIESLFSIVNGITNNVGKTRRFFPLVTTFFLFILLNNWLGLLPGVGTIGFTEKPGEEHADVLVSQTYAATEETHTDEAPEANPAAGEHTETLLENTSGHTEELELETTSEHKAADSHSEGVFVPYLRAGTADLNTTLALALITVVMTQVYGISYLSLGYFKKFFNFSDPIMFFVGILELISEVGKILSFAFRLFGNIFAGEVLLVVITFLAKVVAPMPFYGLEIFVGFIQAFVFFLLSTVFYNIASESHEAH